jgi:hypothetical protein
MISKRSHTARRLGACVCLASALSFAGPLVDMNAAHAGTKVIMGEGITPPAVKRVHMKKRHGMIHISWTPGAKKVAWTYEVTLFGPDGSTVLGAVYSTTLKATDFIVSLPAGSTIYAMVVETDPWGQQAGATFGTYITK